MATSTPELQEAVRLLRAGQLVAFPTETVYGLGANALDAEAVARIYAAKGRPATSPLIVHVTGAAMARQQVVSQWPETAQKLADAFWPGPLTLVLPKQAHIPDIVTAGLATVGVRQPAHPIAQTLLEAVQLPLAAPSANLFTQLSPTTAQHVRDGLGERVALVLDGGPCTVGLESTVLSLAGEQPVLLRPGMVTKAQLEAIIGPVLEVEASAPGTAHPAPGLHHKHYSPHKPLRLGLPKAGTSCVYLWHSQAADGATISQQLPSEPEAYAAKLYQALHEADAMAVAEIVVEPVPLTPAWAAIRDRLSRAAAE